MGMKKKLLVVLSALLVIFAALTIYATGKFGQLLASSPGRVEF
jgi:hypothetical protein